MVAGNDYVGGGTCPPPTVDPSIAALKRFTPDRIDKHIREFRELASDKESRNRSKFIAKGAFLSAIRDALDERLKAGWDFITRNPDNAEAADLWFSLLERYEWICDILHESADQVSMEEATKLIFRADTI